MTRDLDPDVAHFERRGFLPRSVLAYGLVAGGREVLVIKRGFNVIITLGPRDEEWFDDQW